MINKNLFLNGNGEVNRLYFEVYNFISDHTHTLFFNKIWHETRSDVYQILNPIKTILKKDVYCE